MAEPTPSNVSPWYLRNINQALALDEVTGTVYLNTNAQIVGNVTIGASIDAHVSELGNINISNATMPVTAANSTNYIGKVRITDGINDLSLEQPNNDGESGQYSIPTESYNMLFNGSSWDRMRGNSANGMLTYVTNTINSNVTGGNINAVVSGSVTSTQGTTPWVVSGNVTTVGNLTNDGKPWNLQVAQGLVPGITGLSISGYGANIGTSFIPAWELATTYAYLPSAQLVRVWSSSASDTNVSILISGLDAAYAIQTETVVLTSGITGTLSTKQFLRINSISLVGTVENIGAISVGSSDKTITSAYFGPPSNITAGRSQMSIYTVPAGYTFYLTQSNWYTNQTGSQTAFYRSWTRSSTGIINIVLTFPMQQQYNSVKVVPRPYPEKTDIQWQVASSSGTSDIGGQIEGYLIAN